MGKINRQEARLVGGSRNGQKLVLGKAEKALDFSRFDLDAGENVTERYTFTEKDADGTRVYVAKEETK